MVTVVATDPDNNRGEKSVEVRVTNANELGEVALSALLPRVGVPLTASLSDPDGGVHGIKWQWHTEERKHRGGHVGHIQADCRGRKCNTLTVTASYSDAQGSGKMATSPPDTADVGQDTRNKAPKFPDQDAGTDGTQNTEAERTIAENADAGDPLNGGAVTAVDTEGDTLTYTLGGADASSFAISSVDAGTAGQITVGSGTKLDYETKQTYMVTVIATDSFNVSTSINVTINVTDENEGPKISVGGLAIAGPPSVSYAEDRRDAVATYSATGPESANASWALSGDDAGAFSISRAGELTFKSAPDYENAADADTDNVYEVTVEADDGTYEATRNVVVTVTDVEDDAPVIDDPVALYDANDRRHD